MSLGRIGINENGKSGKICNALAPCLLGRFTARFSRKFCYGFITIFLVLTLFVMGCQNSAVGFNSVGMLIDAGQLETFHKNRLTDKETPYSLCFENVDGSFSLYIFSSPIAFYDTNDVLKIIDTTLVSISDAKMKCDGYSLETKSCDIKSYYPESLTNTPFMIQSKDYSFSFTPSQELIGGSLRKGVFTDAIGREHTSAVYPTNGNTQIEYVSTTAGIMTNITINEKPYSNQLAFYIDAQTAGNPIFMDNQCVLFHAENSIKSVINTSFLQDSLGKTSFNNLIYVEPSENQWKYTIALDENFLNNPNTKYPLVISPTFEIFRNNTPDLTIYSNKPDINISLANSAVIGKDSFLGISQHYLQFRINYIFKSYEQNIISAEYVSAVLSKTDDALLVEMLSLRDFWSASGVNWHTKLDTYGKAGTASIYGAGIYEIDITTFVKSCVKDDRWYTEAYGLIMVAVNDSSGTKVIATADNAFYQPFVRIDFYDLPWKFERIIEINPNQGFIE